MPKNPELRLISKGLNGVDRAPCLLQCQHARAAATVASVRPAPLLQAVQDGLRDGMLPIGRTELLDDGSQMKIDRTFRHTDDEDHFPGSLSFTCPEEALQFAFNQLVDLGVLNLVDANIGVEQVCAEGPGCREQLPRRCSSSRGAELARLKNTVCPVGGLRGTVKPMVQSKRPALFHECFSATVTFLHVLKLAPQDRRRVGKAVFEERMNRLDPTRP